MRCLSSIDTLAAGCAALAVALPLAVCAAATYSYEEDGEAYVVTVPTNETVTLSADAVAVLQANVITNFYKRGPGRLIISDVTTNFTGHFWIQDGILTSKPTLDAFDVGNRNNLTMGKLASEANGGGAIHVCEGASFSVDERVFPTTYGSHIDQKTVYIGGRGFGGIGALTVLSGEDRGLNIYNLWGRNMILTSDTLVYNHGASYVGFAGFNGTLDMNGHNLTVGGSSTGGIYIRIAEAEAGRESRLGDITVEPPGFNMTGYGSWFGSSTAYSNHTMRVKNGARLILNNWYNSAHGRLVLEDGATIQLNDAQRETYNAMDGNFNTYHLWAGEVEAGTTERITITAADNSKNRYLQYTGRISGCGFLLKRGTRLIIRKHPTTPIQWQDYPTDPWPNCFTGGIVATEGSDVTVLGGNMLPATGDLVLSNSSFSVANGATYYLPAVRCSGKCKFLGKMDNDGKPGVRDKRQYYPTLQFYQGSIGQFSTNVAVTTFLGLPQIQAYPADTSAKPVHPYLAVSTGPDQFLIDRSWTIDTEDVVAGDCLTFESGEIKFSSGVNIYVKGSAKGSAKHNGGRYKIADAAQVTFAGSKTVTVDEPTRWKFVVGADGKSLYLDYIPFGTTVIMK